MAMKRPSADDRFRRAIDDFNFWDQVAREADKECDLLRAKIRNIVKRRGRGVYNGNESSINAYDVKRMVINNDRVREIISDPKQYAKCFKVSTVIAIDGGPLKADPEPNLGPPEVQEVQCK